LSSLFKMRSKLCLGQSILSYVRMLSSKNDTPTLWKSYQAKIKGGKLQRDSNLVVAAKDKEIRFHLSLKHPITAINCWSNQDLTHRKQNISSLNMSKTQFLITNYSNSDRPKTFFIIKNNN